MVPLCQVLHATGCSAGHLHPCLQQKHLQSTECSLWGAVRGLLSMSFLKGIFSCSCCSWAVHIPSLTVSSAKIPSFDSFRLHTADVPKGREEQQQDQITPHLPQGQLFWES